MKTIVATLLLLLANVGHAAPPTNPQDALVETNLLACDRGAVVVRVMSQSGRTEKRTFVRSGHLIEVHFVNEQTNQRLDLRFEWYGTPRDPRVSVREAPLGFQLELTAAAEILEDFRQHDASCKSKYGLPTTSHFYWN